MSRDKEAYSTHCRFCFLEFEASSTEAVIAKVEEHEKKCPDPKASAWTPEPPTGRAA